jgi:low affinity Fe/Cu permease
MAEKITVRERFNRLADAVTTALGSLPVLIGSVVIVVLWALTGPIFNFSDTWQLFINTTTTVITFWMVFVIQNSANRASKATQLKLDELIRAVDRARNEFIALDRAPEAVLVEHEKAFVDLANDDAKPTVVKQRTKTRVTRPAKSGSRSGPKPPTPVAN